MSLLLLHCCCCVCPPADGQTALHVAAAEGSLAAVSDVAADLAGWGGGNCRMCVAVFDVCQTVLEMLMFVYWQCIVLHTGLVAVSSVQRHGNAVFAAVFLTAFVVRLQMKRSTAAAAAAAAVLPPRHVC
jgi:hypothetical protein